LSHGQLARLAALAEDLRAGHTDGLALRAFVLAAWSMCAPRRQRSTVAVPEWLRFACAQVVEYPNFTGGVAALVRLAGRSPEHVARACRQHYGKRPVDLIHQARMAHAADQLRRTTISVVEIALDCGVENLGHFYRGFRAAHGLSPAAYRRRHADAVSNG
jgi:AraC family cel operon transcriptional repressor